MTTLTRSGIPTTYRETRFRSRRARWAAFFDLVGWRWTYEPFDAEGWIPDFLITGDAPVLVEVGPCTTQSEYEAKAAKPREHQEHPTLVLGPGPSVLDHGLGETAGLLVNEFRASAGPAFWEICALGELAIMGDDVLRPCAHRWKAARVTNLEALWAQAGNVVQWRAR